MPGRVSTRASTTTRTTNKPSQSSRASTSRTSSPAVVVPNDGPSSALRAQICSIFADAQRNTAGHRKLVVNLRKIHEACCYEPTKPTKNAWDAFGEDDFNVEMARCVIRLMGVKKSEGVGDRIVRFLGLFLRHASDKDSALVQEVNNDGAHSFPETPSTRLTSHILSILLPLLASKEKTVRYRSTQLISHIINSLDSVDDEYYHLLRMGLLKRIRDKEPTIRVQAVLGLGRLAGNEGDGDQQDADIENEENSGLLEKLLEVLQNDPSADVRRSLLLNLPLAPMTLPYLLERARDLDPATRRALYSRLLPALGDFRHLSLSMREKLIRWGLRDRDENVRQATARLFRERWIEDCAGLSKAVEEGSEGTYQPPSMDALLELLERIDVINSGVENGIALEAMKEFWDGRPDYREAVNFEDPFWDHMSAESVFLARTFNDFCRNEGAGKYENVVEEKLPEVTKLAFFLQRYTNDLIEQIRRLNAMTEIEGDEDTIEQEFIVEQLLHIALTLDYTDEVGRRKMYALLREILAIAELPDEITRLVVEVLRGVCGNDSAGEREFCGVVLEAVAEVHDTIAADDLMTEDGDESFHSARSELTDTNPNKDVIKAQTKKGASEEQDEEKAIREIMVNMKCLHIAQCMLQNVEDDLQQNVHLVTMLNNLVVPAVRSHEAPIRERGLLCLGLCSLLDKTLAEENLTLFLHCFNKGHDALQITALHVLSDLLITHPSLLSAAVADNSLQKSISKIFSRALKATHTPDVQAAATTALCKLMLTIIVDDEELLKQLVVCYFEPATKENASVRQALSHFLPVYCHSRKENMERMSRVAPSVVHAMLSLGEELDEEEEIVGIGVVANMLVDWTDPRKLVIQDSASVSWDEAGKKEVKSISGDIHLDLAENLLEKALAHGCSKEERKILLSMLGKLYFTATSTAEKLQIVSDLVAEAIDGKVASDATSRNTLAKVQTVLLKSLGCAGMGIKSLANLEATMVEDEGLTVVEEGQTRAPSGSRSPALGSEEETKTNIVTEERDLEMKDSLLEELLEEDEEL